MVSEFSSPALIDTSKQEKKIYLMQFSAHLEQDGGWEAFRHFLFAKGFVYFRWEPGI